MSLIGPPMVCSGTDGQHQSARGDGTIAGADAAGDRGLVDLLGRRRGRPASTSARPGRAGCRSARCGAPTANGVGATSTGAWAGAPCGAGRSEGDRVGDRRRRDGAGLDLRGRSGEKRIGDRGRRLGNRVVGLRRPARRSSRLGNGRLGVDLAPRPRLVGDSASTGRRDDHRDGGRRRSEQCVERRKPSVDGGRASGCGKRSAALRRLRLRSGVVACSASACDGLLRRRGVRAEVPAHPARAREARDPAASASNSASAESSRVEVCGAGATSGIGGVTQVDGLDGGSARARPRGRLAAGDSRLVDGTSHGRGNGASAELRPLISTGASATVAEPHRAVDRLETVGDTVIGRPRAERAVRGGSWCARRARSRRARAAGSAAARQPGSVGSPTASQPGRLAGLGLEVDGAVVGDAAVLRAPNSARPTALGAVVPRAVRRASCAIGQRLGRRQGRRVRGVSAVRRGRRLCPSYCGSGGATGRRVVQGLSVERLGRVPAGAVGDRRADSRIGGVNARVGRRLARSAGPLVATAAADPGMSSCPTPVEVMLGDVLNNTVGDQVPHRETPVDSPSAIR